MDARPRWFGVVAIVCVLSVGGAVAASQGRSVREIKNQGDYAGPPPATLEELTARSTIVVEGTVVGIRPADLFENVEGRIIPTVLTGYTLAKLEWLKGLPSGNQSERIEFVLRHGEREIDGETVRELPEFRPPIVGERYLVFLTELMGMYILASHGAESLFRIESGRLLPAGRSPLSLTLAGADASSVARDLREVPK